MKISIPGICFSGLTWAVFIVAGVCSLQNVNAQTPPTPIATENLAQPATPVTPPPNLISTSPLAQVVRLTQADVDPSVVMAYITNSGSTFNLDSENIIYASDAGVPSTMVRAMIERDQELQRQFTASPVPPQAQQIQTAPTSEAIPENTAEVAAQPETQPAPVAVNYFDDTLSPYGSWVVVNGYGRCWRPTVCVYNSNWQPYCDRGHWVYSDCGWYWSSDYAWGATFHYGRWFRDASIGWCWYPGTVWAPSWVTWRYSNDYCGWAPLPPRTSYQAGVGIVYNGGGVSVGFNFGLGASCFTFVPTQYFCSPHPRNYCVAPAQVTHIYNNTTVINNYNVNNHTVVNHGIPVQNIAYATRTTIHPIPVHEINNYSGAQGHPNYAQGVNRPAFNENSSSQPYSATQNHFPQTPANQNPQAGHSWTAPQNTGDYHSPAHAAPAQTPPANSTQHYNEQSAPAHWQSSEPTGTPRNNAYYYESRQNYSAPAASAPSQSQSSGGHYVNQNWPGH